VTIDILCENSLPAWIIEEKRKEEEKKRREQEEQRPRVYPPGQDPREQGKRYRKDEDDKTYKPVVIDLLGI